VFEVITAVSRMYLRLVRVNSTKISEEVISSMFRIEEACNPQEIVDKRSPACCPLLVVYMVYTPFNFEDGGNSFFRDVGEILKKYSATGPRI
jgi:hypothetical protein